LLRSAGVAFLAMTTGRTLTVWSAHFLAAWAAGAGPQKSMLWMLLDPFEWAFVVGGVVLCRRAWRLAADARQIRPRPAWEAPAARKAWSRGLLAVSAVYFLALIGFLGYSRFQASSYLLQPGVDPQREHEALLALNEGVAQANRGDLAAAEKSFQRSLRLWEQLTARRPAPSSYRRNLAMTLNNLGWLREKQGRAEEAEPFYARAVALADELDGDPQMDDEFRRTVADARQSLADLRGDRSARLLNEKDR